MTSLSKLPKNIRIRKIILDQKKNEEENEGAKIYCKTLYKYIFLIYNWTSDENFFKEFNFPSTKNITFWLNR